MTWRMVLVGAWKVCTIVLAICCLPLVIAVLFAGEQGKSSR